MRNREAGERSKVKFRLVEFEIDGGNAAIQEGLRDVATAFMRASSAAAKPVAGARLSGGGLPPRASSSAPASGQFPLPGIEEEPEDAELEPQADAEDVSEGESSKSARRAVRRHRIPEIVNMDMESGSMSLKAYVAQKSPDSESKKYLVSAAWLKEFRQLDEVGNDHIYTCFRTMGWNVPADVGAPLRGMKKLGWFQSGKAKGHYSITHVGLGAVNDLSKGKS